jgi:hypothetical protein
MKAVLPATLPDNDQSPVPVTITHEVLLRNQKDWVSVSYTSKPVAGVEIAIRWALVILGTSIPLSVDFTSRMAEESGAELSVLIATVWANARFVQKKSREERRSVLFIFWIELCNAKKTKDRKPQTQRSFCGHGQIFRSFRAQSVLVGTR